MNSDPAARSSRRSLGHNLSAWRAVILATALVLLVDPSSAWANWTIVSSKSLGFARPGLEVVETECKNGDSTARVTAILFSESAFTLRVIDSASPGNATLENTLRHEGAPAGVNAGYFHPDFRPIGLVVADGNTLHPAEKAKLLSGIIGATKDGRISIVRSSAHSNKPTAFRDAIQCGPMLVEHGKPVPGLNAERIARRTVAATGSEGRAALVYMTSVSLEDAALILSLPRILGRWSPTSALNLDGGTSSGLWAESVVSLPEIKRVRNFLAVVPRD